uniref:Gfo/Idh/MocA-like oxidoreductase N-terminal domain-containing protein n=1 Tax=Monopterus albus TaxID=43700 RepID=A0A3Q3INU0_MONAL
MTSPVLAIVVGAGSRGEIYSDFASIHPKRMKVVGVADPRKFACRKLQQQHQIVDENIFDDWHHIIEKEKFADAVLICTPDSLHKEPAVAFAKKGYHILLAKPTATTAEDCSAIVEACTQSGVMLSVGHVLRYDPVIRKIKVNIFSSHVLPIKSRKTYFSTFAWGRIHIEILSCLPQPITTKLKSHRCLNCMVQGLAHIINNKLPPKEPRVHVHILLGELSYDGHGIRVFDFLTQRSTKHTAPINIPRQFSMSGRGGADYQLIDAFISAVANNDPSLIRSGSEETLLSHLLVFDAERSRLEGRVVYCGTTSQS